jgi:hypothetical protein
MASLCYCILRFVVEVGVVDLLHFLFGGDCFALGR